SRGSDAWKTPKELCHRYCPRLRAARQAKNAPTFHRGSRTCPFGGGTPLRSASISACRLPAHRIDESTPSEGIGKKKLPRAVRFRFRGLTNRERQVARRSEQPLGDMPHKRALAFGRTKTVSPGGGPLSGTCPPPVPWKEDIPLQPFLRSGV